jgi:hypothetical protein
VSNERSQTPDAAQQHAWDALWRRLLLPSKSLSLPDEGDEAEPESTSEIDALVGGPEINSASKV